MAREAQWLRSALCAGAVVSAALISNACADEPIVVLGDVKQTTTPDAGHSDATLPIQPPVQPPVMDAASPIEAPIMDAAPQLEPRPSDAGSPVEASIMDAAPLNQTMAGDASPRGGRHDDDPFVGHECSEYEPVCGDDNMTYRNTCQALDAGVKVVKRGDC